MLPEPQERDLDALVQKTMRPASTPMLRAQSATRAQRRAPRANHWLAPIRDAKLMVHLHSRRSRRRSLSRKLKQSGPALSRSQRKRDAAPLQTPVMMAPTRMKTKKRGFPPRLLSPVPSHGWVMPA